MSFGFVSISLYLSEFYLNLSVGNLNQFHYDLINSDNLFSYTFCFGNLWSVSCIMMSYNFLGVNIAELLFLLFWQFE